MIHGTKVSAELRKGRRGGIPWMVVLDGEGHEVVTSDGPKGNVGCPMRPHEIDWFMEMVTRASKRMTVEDIAHVRVALLAYAREVLGGE